jgi:hypothetical protein
MHLLMKSRNQFARGIETVIRFLKKEDQLN